MSVAVRYAPEKLLPTLHVSRHPNPWCWAATGQQGYGMWPLVPAMWHSLNCEYSVEMHGCGSASYSGS
eukprot:366555-Chlamydomonas_euryale.AAC.2